MTCNDKLYIETCIGQGKRDLWRSVDNFLILFQVA